VSAALPARAEAAADAHGACLAGGQRSERTEQRLDARAQGAVVLGAAQVLRQVVQPVGAHRAERALRRGGGRARLRGLWGARARASAPSAAGGERPQAAHIAL
jgi:hypothetical protein